MIEVAPDAGDEMGAESGVATTLSGVRGVKK